MVLERSFLLVCINIITIVVLLLILNSSLKGRINGGKLRVAYFLIFLFCMFSFWGPDWFHYLEIYNILHVNDFGSHLEPLYIELIKNYTLSYLQFRFIIWGVALWLLYLTVKRINLNRGIATIFFVVTTLIWFSYARVSLAMAVMMYGATYMVSDDGKFRIQSFLVGIILFVFSFYLHKSAIFGLTVIVVSYIALLSPRKVMLISAIAYPALVILVANNLGIYMDFETDNEMMQSVNSSQQYYLEAEAGVRGIGAWIDKSLEWFPKYMLMYVCYKIIRENIKVPARIRLFNNIMFFTMLLSSIFFFDLGYNTNIVFSRFQRFAIIPMFIMLAYFYENNIHRSLIKRTTILAFISTSYSLVYSAYNTLY